MAVDASLRDLETRKTLIEQELERVQRELMDRQRKAPKQPERPFATKLTHRSSSSSQLVQRAPSSASAAEQYR